MSFKGKLLRVANRALGFTGYQLAPILLDFTDRLDDTVDIARLHRDLARDMGGYLRQQSIVGANCDFDMEREVASFYEKFLRSPFREITGGSRFNNLLWLFILARSIRPSIIVDSGTYWGASAWALSLGAPDTPIHSFDIDLSRLKVRRPNVEYHEHDWSSFELSGSDVSKGMIYFDDHVDQARRLIEARQRKFPFAVFDDDFPVTSFAEMAHDGFSLPKLEFVIDDELRGREQLAWISKGRRRVWKIDHSQLLSAREAIFATERLPNTSYITGIWQTPYRVVAIRP